MFFVENLQKTAPDYSSINSKRESENETVNYTQN